MPNNNYDGDIDAAGQKYNVDPALIKTVFHLESSGGKNTGPAIPGDPDSPIGPMQMRPSTAKTLGVDPTNIHQAIDGAARYLAQGLNLTQSPEGALRYYYGGPDQSQWGPKTDAYAAKGAAMYPQMQLTGGGQSTQEAKPAKLTGADIRKSFEAPQAPAAADASPGAKIRSLFPTQEAPTATPPQQPAATTPVQVDDLGRPLEAPSANANPVEDAAKSAVQGAKEGFGGEPLGLSPEHEKQLQDAGVYNKPGENNPLKAINKGIIGGLAAGGDLALRTGAALLRGGQGAVSSALSSIPAASIEGPGFLRESAASLLNPSLAGRDVAATPEAFPTGDTTGGTAIPAPQATAKPNPLTTTISQAAHDQLDAPLSASFKDNPGTATPSLVAGETNANPLASVPTGWTIDDRFRTQQQPSTTPITPGQVQRRDGVGYNEAVRRAAAENASPPQPQSVGAAASRDTTAVNAIPPETPEQQLTNLGKSVTQSAEDRAGPQLRDNDTYVQGVERPLAAREFSPQNSLDDKLLRATDPAYRAEQEKIERNNNQVMVDLLGNDAGDANALKAAHDARAEVAPPAQQLFANEKPVNAAPIAQQIDDILAGPDGKRDGVVKTLNSIKKSLYDTEGNLETLPSQLYGVRQNITDQLKKGVGDAADDVRASKPILMGLLDKLDPIINGGAPKYQEYLDQFREASQPINQMEFLQKYQTGPRKLANVDGYLQLSKVQKMLDDIYQGRSAKGINPAKSLTDDQVQNIVNVRNELAAMSLKDRLAKVKGSDTTQQVNRSGLLGEGPLGTAVKSGAELGAHALLLHTTGGLGNIALAMHNKIVKPAREAAKAAKMENALAVRKAELLSTQPRNPLTHP